MRVTFFRGKKKRKRHDRNSAVADEMGEHGENIQLMAWRPERGSVWLEYGQKTRTCADLDGWYGSLAKEHLRFKSLCMKKIYDWVRGELVSSNNWRNYCTHLLASNSGPNCCYTLIRPVEVVSLYIYACSFLLLLNPMDSLFLDDSMKASYNCTNVKFSRWGQVTLSGTWSHAPVTLDGPLL